jgi:cytochrome P450
VKPQSCGFDEEASMPSIVQPVEGIARFAGDMFADDVLADTNPTFQTLRDLGDVVWLDRHDLYAVARYDDVARALRADDVLISGQGVSVNHSLNGDGAPTGTSTLNSDGERHRKLKSLEMRPLMPSQMKQLRERVFALADQKVAELAIGSSFEAMSALASFLPTAIVADLVGIKGLPPERMLEWSNAIFDAFGPAEHFRTGAALPTIGQFVQFGRSLTREDLVPGSWADLILEASENGELPMAEARDLIFDYVLPSLDTTIYSTGEMLYQLASSPDAFRELRKRPELIAGIINESVRLASPLRGFTRFAKVDFGFADCTVPAGSRLWLLNASGNRDERHYNDPDRFDIERNPRDHLGWGHGVHLCSGMHLARLEMEAILMALIGRVQSMEAGNPVRIVNNSAQGFATMPLILHPS